MPAQAGIHLRLRNNSKENLDSDLRRNDGRGADFYSPNFASLAPLREYLRISLAVTRSPDKMKAAVHVQQLAGHKVALARRQEQHRAD